MLNILYVGNIYNICKNKYIYLIKILKVVVGGGGIWTKEFAIIYIDFTESLLILFSMCNKNKT